MSATLRRATGGAILFAMAAPAIAQSRAPAPDQATSAATAGQGSGQAASSPATAPAPSPASPATTDYPADASGDGATPGGYNLSRWAEDWTRYRDPAKRDDPIDRLKFLPLASEGAVYLTLSGELRLRVNHTTNPNLRDSRAQRQDINRIVGGADLHVGPHLRAYGELAHGGISGVELGTPAATLRNDLIVQQAFVEGTADIADVAVGVRYGRQEFIDGANLLTSARDNNTIRFVLNGWRGWARARSVRLDLFDFAYTQFGERGTADDRSNDRTRFSGITTGIVVPTGWFGGSALFVDPYVWRLRNDDALWGTRTAREARHYYGIHAWGAAGPVTIDWTLNRQGGTYDGRRIAAWQALFAQTYRMGGSKTAPQIGFHADYASGGGAYGTGTLRNAFAPFGNNVYYSYQLFATPTNLVAIAPNYSFTPIARVRFTAEYQRSWRDSLTDAVYRANGTAFAGTQTVGGRRIADTIRAQAIWSITPRLTLTGRYEHLIAGPALRQAKYRSSDFLAGWLSFRF